MVLPSGLCVTHDATSAAYAKFQAGPDHQPGPGGKRKPGTLDAMVALVEQQPERFLGVVWDALNAERDDGSPDHDTRLKALSTALDRAFGKPKQSVDQTIEAGESLAALLAPTPLASTDTPLPEAWEGTDG